jgi:hypothetical protein
VLVFVSAIGSNSPYKGWLAPQQKGKKMGHRLIDENGTTITGQIRMVFVCDMCGNTADFYHGMTTYAGVIKNTITQASFCSEICARKATA